MPGMAALGSCRLFVESQRAAFVVLVCTSGRSVLWPVYPDRLSAAVVFFVDLAACAVVVCLLEKTLQLTAADRVRRMACLAPLDRDRRWRRDFGGGHAAAGRTAYRPIQPITGCEP